MEGVEGALDVSVAPAAAVVKDTDASFGFSDELLLVGNNNGQSSAVVENDSFVDDLLDFSNASLIEDSEEHKQGVLSENDCCATKTAASAADSNVGSSAKEEFESLPVNGLPVPADDVESLEWLSHFVDDSFTQYSLTCPVSKFPSEALKARSEPEMVMVEVKPTFIPTPVQTKARTKRARTGVRVWSLGSPSFSESPSSSTSSSSTTTSSSSPVSWLLYSSSSGQYQTQTVESFVGRRVAKKPKKKPAVADAGGGLAQQTRRCSHCGVQKTPQWRAGPLGAKTLCNACGVRFKSGRLLPEYRPACSPTFSSELHSNNHRKVLEMRRKKEVETGFGPPVQSF
ncbi:OLC1v1010972C2 [Oldenlandia corymbosa var. corymbosa]|nr:OLC1v1010972C2 [Oldenlandia corymbosa var. corymbosa]